MEFLYHNNKFFYYLRGFFIMHWPRMLCRNAHSIVDSYLIKHPDEREYVNARVNHYCRLTLPVILPSDSLSVSAFEIPPKVPHKPRNTPYYIDAYEHLRHFDGDCRFVPCFGDVNYVPDVPSLVKSRPICEDASLNENSVLLCLNKIRHFNFINDPYSWSEKKDMLVGRSVVVQPQRERFIQMYFDHPMCDLGQINRHNLHDPRYLKPKMPIGEHLKYKFILCIEGHDVASNLKWVMSSNSLPVMPKPKFETWFMESTLVPDYHYVCISDDYSDLEERLRYYISHPDEACAIIEHNHEFVNQFRDTKRETVISLCVLQRYFKMTN